MIPELLADGDVGVELGVGVESSLGEVGATDDVVGSVSALVAVGDVTVDVTVETSVVVVAVSGIVPGSVFPLPPSTDSPPESPPESGEPFTVSTTVTAASEPAKIAAVAATPTSRWVPIRRRVFFGLPGDGLTPVRPDSAEPAAVAASRARSRSNLVTAGIRVVRSSFACAVDITAVDITAVDITAVGASAARSSA